MNLRRRLLRSHWIAFATALVVRLAWVLFVQSPNDAIRSDAEAYVNRATELLEGTELNDPRLRAFYPWGAHTLMAGEFAIVGRSEIGIAIIHALVGALPALFVTLMAARAFRGGAHRSWVLRVGLAVALWQPLISFVGYYMSEIWFTAANAAVAYCFLRQQKVTYRIATGLVLALAFVIRPQILLTCGLVVIALAVPHLKQLKDFSWRPWAARWAVLIFPVAIAIAGSSYRLYRLTGDIGMISQNGPLMRIFAETNIGRVSSSWSLPDGRKQAAWFATSMKAPFNAQNSVQFKGYIGDPKILEDIRVERTRDVPLWRRVGRMLKNTRHLVLSLPNPEAEILLKSPRRAFLLETFRVATLALLPLALLGIVPLLRRHRLLGIVVAANLLTAILTAAFYYSEARYRTPYDVFLIVAAASGLVEITRFVRERELTGVK